MTQHTPGPWELRHSPRHGYFFIDYPQQEGSATLTKLDCEEADARLIAAAPELLKALQGIMVGVAGCQKNPEYEVARAAMAKAMEDA
jgi:hypothetical protein